MMDARVKPAHDDLTSGARSCSAIQSAVCGR